MAISRLNNTFANEGQMLTRTPQMIALIVGAVEALPRTRGIHDVFALTLQPEFFAAIGYERVDRARYPEKIRRDCLGCARRFACNETCSRRTCRLSRWCRGRRNPLERIWRNVITAR